MNAYLEPMTSKNTVIVDARGNLIPGRTFIPTEVDHRYLITLPVDNEKVLGILRRKSDGGAVTVAPAVAIGGNISLPNGWRRVLRYGPGTSELFLLWAFVVE